MYELKNYLKLNSKLTKVSSSNTYYKVKDYDNNSKPQTMKLILIYSINKTRIYKLQNIKFNKIDHLRDFKCLIGVFD